MAIRNILRDTDPTLRKVCRPVETFDNKLHLLLEDMTETMYESNGVGLAAPQVGILRRVVVIDIGEGIIELINPKITAQAGEISQSEGCLSFPGQFGMVARPQKVTVQAQDRNGVVFEVQGEDLLARALCHELDHLDGKLFIDLATEMLD